MAEEYIKRVESIFKEVCDLTDTNCNVHLAKFKEDGNLPVLINSVFITLDKCDSEKCNTNKAEILEKLDKFITELGG